MGLLSLSISVHQQQYHFVKGDTLSIVAWEKKCLATTENYSDILGYHYREKVRDAAECTIVKPYWYSMWLISLLI